MDSDGIKWPADFSELQAMDSAFKCGICYDYMKTSMITLCSHTYCSLCIRKFLQYSSKCPTCFIETHENDLRNNRPLDNIIMLYLEVRNKLLRALRVAEAASRGSISSSPAVNSNPSSQVIVSTSAVTPKSGLKSFLVSSSQRSFDKTPTAKSRLFPPENPSIKSEEDVPESLECKVPLMFTTTVPSSSSSTKQKAPVEKAQCPVCQVEIPSRNINLHLDACLDRSKTTLKEGTTAVPIKKRNPLPKRLYHMMNDKVLKQELKSHGLNIQGDRKAWLNRIRRFTVIYNSETDVDNPRPVSALIQQLEREEREEKRKDNPLFKSLSQKVDRYSNPDAIAKANKQYIEDNKDSFQKLIEAMKSREGRNIKPMKPINLLESDEEGEGLRIVGGTSALNPDEPSTSTAPLFVSEDQSKDSLIESSVTDVQDNDELAGVTEIEDSPERRGSSSVRPRLLSESSGDSVFDFTPSRTSALTSSRKKLVKRPASRNKSRSTSPDLFNETTSAISEHCLPDADLYQSIFGDDGNNDQEICKSGSDIAADVMDCSSLDKSPFSSDLGNSKANNGDEPDTTPIQMRPKRKQPSNTRPNDTEPLATRRSRRNIKKQKSTPT